MPFALAPLTGLLVGSFLNVVAYRLPRRESLVTPASRCPGCDTPIKPWDNVPVLSWLLLRGRCRSCSERISPRYPLVELVTAALYLLVVVVKGLDSDAWLGLALVTMLVPMTIIDLEHRIVPNRLLAPSALAAVAILAATDASRLPEHLLAGLAAGGFLLLAAIASPKGMGMGDVKLAAVLGLYLGWSVAPAMLVALVTGTVVGVAVIARVGVVQGRKTAVPFGPFLAVGALVALVVGPALVDRYLGTFG
jgi:leader peptidase (prepilin peptidase)/N-methyltransferase